MINIRSGIFETNSSSTHSLSMQKDEFTKWITDAFADFHSQYPDNDVELKFSIEDDYRFNERYLVASLKMQLENE